MNEVPLLKKKEYEWSSSKKKSMKEVQWQLIGHH